MLNRHDDMKDLRCMSFTSKGTGEIIAAGLQNTMLVVDLNKGEVTEQVACPFDPTVHHDPNIMCRYRPNISILS